MSFSSFPKVVLVLIEETQLLYGGLQCSMGNICKLALLKKKENSLVPPLGWRNAHKTNKYTGKVGSYHKCAPVDAMGLVSSVFLVHSVCWEL